MFSRLEKLPKNVRKKHKQMNSLFFQLNIVDTRIKIMNQETSIKIIRF